MTITVSVAGMTCRHCVRTVSARLRDVPGVVAVQADATTTTVVLHGTMDADDVLAALDEVGFPGTPTEPAAARASRVRGSRAAAPRPGPPPAAGSPRSAGR